MASELRRSVKEKAKGFGFGGSTKTKPGGVAAALNIEEAHVGETGRTRSLDLPMQSGGVTSAGGIGHGHFNPLAWENLSNSVRTRLESLTKLPDFDPSTGGYDQQHAPISQGGAGGGFAALDKDVKRRSRVLIQPKGTIAYNVANNDTLASIAAQFDCTTSELKTLNRLMGTALVFPGQVLYVPDRNYVSSGTSSPSPSPTNAEKTLMTGNESVKQNTVEAKSSVTPLAAGKLPGHAQRQVAPPGAEEAVEVEPPRPLSEEEARQLDEECCERFIKVDVKYITLGQGVVNGVLLVTPNAIMFDPNVSDPLVIERGAEKYGVIAPMDMVMSVAIYHDIAAMRIKGKRSGDRSSSKPHVYHGNEDEVFGSSMEDKPSPRQPPSPSIVLQSTSDNAPTGSQGQFGSPSSLANSSNIEPTTASDATCSTVAKDPSNRSPSPGNRSLEGSPSKVSSHQSGVDSALDSSAPITAKLTTKVSGSSDSSPRDFLLYPTATGKVSPAKSIPSNNPTATADNSGSPSSKDTNPIPAGSSDSANQIFKFDETSTAAMTREQLGSSGADSGSSPSRAKSSPTSIPPPSSPGATVSASGQAQQGIFSRTLGSISSLGSSISGSPGISRIVDFSSGLFGLGEDEKGKEDSRTGEGQDAGAGANIEVENAVKPSERLELFQSIQDRISRPLAIFEDPPLFLCLRIGQPVNKSVSQTCPIEAYRKNKKKPEYWFSVPRDKVDRLYAFFIHWSPTVYGDRESTSSAGGGEQGFVVINDSDSEQDEEGAINVVEDHFDRSEHRRLIHHLTKDWELVKREDCTSPAKEVQLVPELLDSSAILKEEHILLLGKNLPARAEGYPWKLLYSSEKHGFSLKSLYRCMGKIDCPTFIIVMDSSDQIFGAVLSCAPKVSEHFYGSGECCLFTFYPEFKIFHWSGHNTFFIKGNKESLAVGSGEGSFGLWLDGDLYHGRTKTCQTFSNDLLTVAEDFYIKALEVWGFV